MTSISKITSSILCIVNLCSCFGDLRSIQVFDSTSSESFYGINSNAVDSLKNLTGNSSIALRHDSKHGIIFQAGKDRKYYKIKRSDDGNLNIKEELDLESVGNAFNSNNYGTEFLDALYYESVDGNNNTQLLGDDNVRVVCINEEDANKDPRVDGHKFKTHFIRIRYHNGEIQRSEIDIQDLAEKLKEKFDNMAAAVAEKIGFKHVDLVETDLSGPKEDISLSEENKQKIKAVLKEAKNAEEIEKKIEILAGYKPDNILFIKVDKGAYVLVRCTNGMPIVASYEIVTGKERVYLASFN